MDISQLLSGPMGQQIIGGIGQQAGTSEKDTASVVSAAAPILMGMLQKNASSPSGADSLMNALGKHDGSILNNLSGFLGAGDTSDGLGILGHVLGGNQNTVENAISKETGVSAASVTKIIALLAPIVLGYLGQQSRDKNVQQSGGLGDLIGGLMGGGGQSSNIGTTILSTILSSGGGEGSGIPDVIAAATGQKKKGGLGGLLGGLFGKK